MKTIKLSSLPDNARVTVFDWALEAYTILQKKKLLNLKIRQFDLLILES